MSRAGARASSERVARTPVGKPGRPVTGYLGDEAHLTPIRLDEDMPQDAARGIARWSMLDAHGCTGRGCRRRAHGADRAVRDELLDMLQLRPLDGAA